jgi:hypothetical protein
MFDYLQKYNSLPKELRDKVSTLSVLASIDSLEKKYGVYLASVVMKVMVKEIGINDLAGYFTLEFKLDENKSRALAQELKKEVFAGLGDYLVLTEAVKSQEIKRAERTVKPEPPSRGSNFILAPEDEKEIKDLAQKVDGYFNKSDSDNNIEAKLDNVIKEIKINFGSELLAGRFRYILKTYLRGIRDKIDTREALIKPIDLGGLGFDLESTSNILAIVEKNGQKLGGEVAIKPPIKINLPRTHDALTVRSPDERKLREAKMLNAPSAGSWVRGLPEDKISGDKATPRPPKSAGVHDVPYDFMSLKKNGVKTTELDLTHELPPPAPQAVSRKAEELVKTPPKIKEPIFSSKPKISQAAHPKEADKALFPPKVAPPPRLSAQSRGKIKMEDIKFEPKIMGPIDELKYMNLVNFRRLNKDPFLAANIVKEKIDLLDEEYSKRIEGIKAWRVSPLNRLYLEMGSESISNKKAIDAIIEERKASGKEYLTAKEMEAIIELNRELRF